MSSTTTEHSPPTASDEPLSKKQKIDGASSSSSSSKYTLYSYWRSSASWRARIALHYKEIPFTIVPINLLKSEQLTEEYIKQNPQRKVPLLVIDGDENKSIAQSLAIIDYLEHAHPECKSLFPKDPFLRARAVQLAEGINADIQPLQNLSVLKQVGSLVEKDKSEETKTAWGKWAVSNGLRAMETLVAQTAGRYCIGNEITIADVCLVPQMSASRRFNIDLTQYPTLLRIEKELAQHPAFKAGHANAQEDKPKDMAPIE